MKKARTYERSAKHIRNLLSAAKKAGEKVLIYKKGKSIIRNIGWI